MSQGFGTKAETLDRLRGVVSRSVVEDLLYFSVSEYRSDGDRIAARIMSRFADRQLAIRSSGYMEDGQGASLAGAYLSCLNVAGEMVDIHNAIRDVVASFDGDDRDQVLVQPMLTDIIYSGVAMTRDLATGGPYYILNYDDESGRTDRVTSGVGVTKTVVVHRDYRSEHTESPRIRELLEMCKELEAIFGDSVPLDIEFAKSGSGTLYLMQVRRICAEKQWKPDLAERVKGAAETFSTFFIDLAKPRPGIVGRTTILGQMPDWNPAEIIGTNPRPLAVSLYRSLVTDSVWQEARARMGYRPVPDEHLMVQIAGRPYIDVRNSFNSFLPAAVDDATASTIVDSWLGRLSERPEFHDKVEFEIAQTAMDFTFDQDYHERYDGTLTDAQFASYREALCGVTAANLDFSSNGSLKKALFEISILEARQDKSQSSREGLRRLDHLLNECRRLGTLPFAVIARHAFIAEALLRSAVRRGAISETRIGAFRSSLSTVAGELATDFSSVMNGGMTKQQFLRRYGHLRPGTYDLLSLRYDQRQDLFEAQPASPRLIVNESFILSASEYSDIANLLHDAGLQETSPDILIKYAETAIINREYSKFIFTRHLSDALEEIAAWGAHLGLSRDDLSYLSIEDIMRVQIISTVRPIVETLLSLANARRLEAESARHISMGYIIRDVRDVYVVPMHRSAPNFVTAGSVEAPTVLLDGRSSGSIEMDGRIACIENADPGFDWIFTRGIVGLVSKFGGANSHMTIRCAELNLPAAIGVGELLFKRIIEARSVELRCADRIVRPSVIQPTLEDTNRPGSDEQANETRIAA